ncbi:MAG: DUF4390 domain-containing protein [Syntrophus sp. (in: bacteria)]|nr:DUF4390 domain-containing protein [Syntrophus sp. (in: bacteria)]
MKKRRFTTVALLVLLFLPSFPAAAMGMQAEIRDVLITQSIDYIHLYAKVSNSISKDMEKAILAGVPTTITFLVDLYQERSLWFDRKVAGVVIKQTIKYDNVKKMFYVWLHNMQDPEGFQDFESAKRAITELNGVVVAPVRQLQRYTPTYIMVKAKLDKVRLPLGMEYVLFFVSLWDFETDWYKQRFIF